VGALDLTPAYEFSKRQRRTKIGVTSARPPAICLRAGRWMCHTWRKWVMLVDVVNRPDSMVITDRACH
jgi:hypothetical protein